MEEALVPGKNHHLTPSHWLLYHIRQLRGNLAGKSHAGKIFEGGLLFRIMPTTLLQIFCKIILNSKVIIKSIIDPDDNSHVYGLWSLAGKSHAGEIFKGGLSYTIMPSTLLQIFCKIIMNSKVIIKSIIDPDDNSHVYGLWRDAEGRLHRNPLTLTQLECYVFRIILIIYRIIPIPQWRMTYETTKQMFHLQILLIFVPIQQVWGNHC